MGKKFDRIYIEISNICNFRCPFCSGVSRPPREMSTDEFSLVLNQVKLYTSEICLHVLGEPLMYKELSEVLQLCRQSNVKVNLVTNGYFIAEKLSLLLQYFDVFKKINFSIHSYLYHNDNMIQNFTDIIKAGVDLSSKGVSVELRNLSDNIDFNFTNTLAEALKACTDVGLLDVCKNQKIKEKLYYVIRPPFIWPDRSKSRDIVEKSVRKLYCQGGKTHIAILSDLTVVPCCLDTAGEIAIGNMKETSLQQLLDSDKYINICQSFSQGKAAHSLCRTCQYANK